MPLAADLVQVAFAKESGVPPVPGAAPVFNVARITSEGVAFAPTTATSAELDPSGNIRDSILTGGASTGPINLEVSDHQAFEDYLECVLGAPWTADVIENGPAQLFFLMEKMFPGIPAPGEEAYHRFDRSAFTAMTINIAPGSPIDASVTVNGGEMSLDTAPLPGATYVPAGTEPVLVPSDVEVSMDVWAATACFSALTMTFDTGARDIQCIGTLGTKESVRGRLNATITATLYYSNDEVVQALLDQSEFPITVTLNDAAGAMEYKFEFPRCKLTAAPVVAPGTNQDVTVGLAAQALYDETANCTVRVTRAA